jgi:hypothetical protein
MNTYENRYKADWDADDRAACLLEVTEGDGGPHLKWFDKDGWNWLAHEYDSSNGNDVEWRPMYENKDRQRDLEVLKDIMASAGVSGLDEEWAAAAKRLLGQ